MTDPQLQPYGAGGTEVRENSKLRSPSRGKYITIVKRKANTAINRAKLANHCSRA